MRLEVIEDLGRLEALQSEWQELAKGSGGSQLFQSPSWLLPWWHAYRGALGAELLVISGRNDDGELVFLAPLYRREARVGPGIKVEEIRIIGDAGPRPPALDVLVAPGYEEAAGVSIAEVLKEREQQWDVVDLEPLREPSRVRAFCINRLASAGFSVESGETGGSRSVALDVPGLGPEQLDDDAAATEYTADDALVSKGLSVLRRLSRLEWADREENSPLADAQATQLLEEVATSMAASGAARVARIEDRSGAAMVAALVVDDGDRAVVVAMGVDPESGRGDAARRLLTAQARSAGQRGKVGLDLVIGADEYEMPPLPQSRQRAVRVAIYNHTTAAGFARTYGAVRKRVEAARTAPGAAAAGARAAWAKIRGAAATVAERDRLHLYRGELWTRGITPTEGLSVRLLGVDDFEGMSEPARRELIEILELDAEVSERKWRRGDLAIYATIHGRPAGIGWCARTAVDVPELGRRLNLSRHEAYIYDLFVAPSARGRAVAPSMLEFLAHELRQRDVYRSWALIGADNAASIRAFEKASYTAVADVIYTRVGAMDRITVRPPDPEARELLGLA